VKEEKSEFVIYWYFQ